MTAASAKDCHKFYPLGELASQVGATLKGDPEIRIRGIGPLEDSAPDQLSFLVHARYLPLLASCKAAALVVSPAHQDLDCPLLIVDQPYLAMARIAQLFAASPVSLEGIHTAAHVDDKAELGAGVSVGPLAHIGAECRVGKDTQVHGAVYLGRGVTIGEACVLYPGATILDHCQIGNRVVIHSGVVIGSDGFGFAQDGQGHHIKIPQAGIVQIDDDVEIGANSTIDRATFGRTWIQRGAKIDNLVQIGHNVVVGEYAILVAQVGISGSTRLGRHVVLAGQVGVVGHIEIGDRVRIGAKSGVPHSIKADTDVMGIPAMPQKEYLRQYAHLRRLPHYQEELKRLRTRIQKLEETLEQLEVPKKS